MQEDAATWHHWAANQKASWSSGRGAQRSSDLGPSMDGFRVCSGFRMAPASGSNQLHGAPQSSHADCTAVSTALACMVHHRAHMQIAQESSYAEHRNVAIVQGPQAKDCAEALGQPLLPVARGMTMPLQLNEAEFSQQGNEAEFAQQGPGNAALGNVVGLSIPQLGHGEVSSSGWRVDRIIAC